jgi:hypothetical protein
MMTDAEPEFECEFDVAPLYHIELRDGVAWVVGNGVELEMDSVEEAWQFVEHLLDDRVDALNDYLMDILDLEQT